MRVSQGIKSGQGDPSLWDERWAGVVGDLQTHFTRGRPETLAQLMNRVYSEAIQAVLSKRTSRSCVEMGAGRGNQALYLASKGIKVTMVDLSESGFELARRNFERFGFECPRMVVADVRDTGLDQDSADLVFSIGLLEHFEDPVPVLEETRRILKPGGQLYHIVVPASRFRNHLPATLVLNPVRFFIDRAKSVAKLVLRRPSRKRKGTITDYGSREYAAWLKELGFKDISIRPICPYHRVYRSDWLDRHVSMRLFRAHNALKKRLGADPEMVTWPFVARSLLVEATK